MWKTDIFSYGMLCWRTILESKCYPFTIPEASQSQVIQKLKKDDKLIETAVIGIRGLNALDEAAHLLQILDCTLQLDPHKRIGTFERVIEILTSDVSLQKKNRCQKYVHLLILLDSCLTET
jgi:hypothetical protein